MKIVPPTVQNLELAARALKEGKLVGMPTETVYGIAADALNASAVRATFEAKGRPAENPLIVHISKIQQLAFIVRDFPREAQALMDQFWPGPLTLVLPKDPAIPNEVTAGLNTVAVRMPSHPVARRLINRAGPVSAPSANRFMGLSPTTAEMVDPDIAERLELILDGGPCTIGIESTVLDLSGATPAILRPGGISRQEIQAVIGREVALRQEGEKRSPGMYPKHYAPRTPVELVDRLEPGQGGLTFDRPSEAQIEMPKDPQGYARKLYSVLYELDHRGLSVIRIQKPPADTKWEAIWDRLVKITSL